MQKRHEQLRAWQAAYALALSLYATTGSFPLRERYGLTAQLRRAAVSIPSNIAEGQGRRSRAQYLHFLGIARGSLLELQTQLSLAKDLGYLPQCTFEQIDEAAESTARQLNALIAALARPNP